MNDDRDAQKTVPDDPKLSALYLRTRNDTSSPALDESIRGAARRVAWRRRYRWLLPLSSAAVVLLGLSLTLRVVELDRPIEEATRFEIEEVEAKSESATIPDRVESAVPAPSSAPYTLSDLPAGDTHDTDPGRKRSMAPLHVHRREERPALILDHAVSMGATAPSRAPEAEFPDELKNDPTLWLRRIRDLASQGRAADAAVQLAEFRAGHPNYPLPDDLAELLDP